MMGRRYHRSPGYDWVRVGMALGVLLWAVGSLFVVWGCSCRTVALEGPVGLALGRLDRVGGDR
jgi:hypothetical protein